MISSNLKTAFAAIGVVAFLGLSQRAEAHFPWLAVDADGHPVLFFGEGLDDRTYHMPDSIKEMKIHHLDDKQSQVLAMKPVESDSLVGLRAKAKVARSGMLVGQQTYGVYHGSKLVYYIQHFLDQNASHWQQELSDAGDLQATLEPADNGINVFVRWKGKPLANTDVKLFCEDGHEEGAGSTDDHGKVHFTQKEVESGLNALVIGYNNPASSGSVGDEAYKSESHYLTVTFPWGNSANSKSEANKKKNAKANPKSSPESTESVEVTSTDLPELPLELTSFGGAVADGKLFIYGGHTGNAHSYSTSEQSDQFWSLELNQPGEWSELPSGPRLQGLVMVPYRDSVIRIGGFTAKNEEGEQHDLHSQPGVSRYDVASKKWIDLAPLPEPRSSLGATILRDHVYVAGGWALRGEETDWHGTAWKLDVSDPNAKWKAVAEPPFRRRALFVASHEEKIYVLGGMGQEGPTTRTDVYDPKTDTWTQGPDLDGDPMTGFGCAAQSFGGHLYVSTIRGDVQRLSDDGKSWEVLGKYDPARFFHVMVPWKENSMLLVGGANMSVGKFTGLDSVTIDQTK